MSWRARARPTIVPASPLHSSCWSGAPKPRPGLQAAEDGDDLAVDGHLVGREFHRLEPFVGGDEHDVVALPRPGLDRRLFARDAGDHDVALLRVALRLGHDEITVEDAGVDHRVATDSEHE